MRRTVVECIIIADMRGMQMARFLQHCVLPRAIFTDIDAVYCAHFVHLLHQQRTGFFQTVFFFDKVIALR